MKERLTKRTFSDGTGIAGVNPSLTDETALLCSIKRTPMSVGAKNIVPVIGSVGINRRIMVVKSMIEMKSPSVKDILPVKLFYLSSHPPELTLKNNHI
ncbi:hypothetical protein Ddc_05710 [Ditylenchus destructor]|nr:hypothetical protein Ddc_05710 [Ditylenchus destructor]